MRDQQIWWLVIKHIAVQQISAAAPHSALHPGSVKSFHMELRNKPASAPARRRSSTATPLMKQSFTNFDRYKGQLMTPPQVPPATKQRKIQGSPTTFAERMHGFTAVCNMTWKSLQEPEKPRGSNLRTNVFSGYRWRVAPPIPKTMIVFSRETSH